MKSKKVVISVMFIALFVVLLTGVSYGYFVYDNNVANIDLSSGSINIDFQKTTNTSSVISNQPISDVIGKSWPSYLEFTVNGTVDEEAILYELEIVKNNNSTVDDSYIKVYLTEYDTTNNVELPLMAPMRYSELYTSLVNNGKGMYQEILSSNNEQSINVSHKYRLRVWLSDEYDDAQTKVFNYSIYMYAKNVNSSNFHKITFILDEGRNEGMSKYVENGRSYGSLPNLVADYRQFLGFFTLQSNGTEVTSATIFNSGTSATTLYSHWSFSKQTPSISAVGENITYGDTLHIEITTPMDVQGIVTVTYNSQNYGQKEVTGGYDYILIEDLDAGDYTFTVTFTPTDINTYNSTSVLLNVHVDKASIDIDFIKIVEQEDGSVAVIIPEEVEEAIVVITVNNNSFSGTTEEGCVLIQTNGIPHGTYDILVEVFPLNSNYESCEIYAVMSC